MPDSCRDPLDDLHFGFDTLERAVARGAALGHPIREFLEVHLFGALAVPPRVLGLSLMGPEQVLAALVIARLAREQWPETLIVAGGSEVTLLAPEIARDRRYGTDIAAFLPGHSEEAFATMVASARAGAAWRAVPGVLGAGHGAVCVPWERRAFRYMPRFPQQVLDAYPAERLTLPLQLTRGCPLHCTMCTYRATEPGLSPEPAWDEVFRTIEHLVACHGRRRFSFKDSYFLHGRLRRLAEGLLARGLRIEWSATTVLHPALTPDLLSLLAASGCRTLEFGLETIHPRGQDFFQKRLPLPMVERVIADAVAAGIAVVTNLIYGLPHESEADALAQVEWFRALRADHRGLVAGSHNLLEVNRRSPLAESPGNFGVRVGGIAPWAFSHVWDAPDWRPAFAAVLRELELEDTHG